MEYILTNMFHTPPLDDRTKQKHEFYCEYACLLLLALFQEHEYKIANHNLLSTNIISMSSAEYFKAHLIR